MPTIFPGPSATTSAPACLPAPRPALATIGVLGAGALGCYYGGLLCVAGLNVRLLLRSEEWARAVGQDGLHVRSVNGDFTCRPNVVRDPAGLAGCDLVVVGLKSTANGELPILLHQMLATCGDRLPAILTLQNGLGNEEALERALTAVLGESDAARIPIIGGIAFLCSNRTAPGHISHTAHGWIKAGAHNDAARKTGPAIVESLRQAGLQIEWTSSLLAARYEKLVWNVPFNGLGVAAEATVADVLALPELAATARSLMKEVVALAQAQNCQLPANVIEDMLHRSAAMGAYRTSMQIDYEQGRPLEVEAILGELVARAKSAGLPTPHIDQLHAVVKFRDSQRSNAESHAR